jgi:hypothetical protein
MGDDCGGTTGPDAGQAFQLPCRHSVDVHFLTDEKPRHALDAA